MELEPLSTSFDTRGIKTGRPIIADGHICKIKLANVGEVTVPDKGKMVVYEYHLVDPAPTTEGKTVNPGFSVSERITLYDKNTPPGVIPEGAMTRIAQRIDAFLGTGDEGNNKGKPPRPEWPGCASDMLGRQAYIKVKAKVGGEFEGNDITKIMALADLQP